MPSISKLLKSSHGRALGVSLAASCLIALLSLTTLGQMLENLALDFSYGVHCSSSTPPELLIIGIDEASFQELRLAWPWPRSLHARLIRRLAEAGARLIVFDIGFGDPSTPQEDQLLADAIRQAHNVILPQTFEVTDDPVFFRRILVQPLEAFRQAAQALGVSMVTPDADSVIRHFHLRLGGQDTLPAAVIRALNPQSSLPPDLSGLIHYVGPPDKSTPSRIIKRWMETGRCHRERSAIASSSSAVCRGSPSCPKARPMPFIRRSSAAPVSS